MLDSAGYRELRNGKWYFTSIERTIGDHGGTEENITGLLSGNVDEELSDIQTLTLEAVNEQIRWFVAPLIG